MQISVNLKPFENDHKYLNWISSYFIVYAFGALELFVLLYFLKVQINAASYLAKNTLPYASAIKLAAERTRTKLLNCAKCRWLVIN